MTKGPQVDPGDLARFDARHLFMAVVKDRAPQVLDDLEALLPLYQAIDASVGLPETWHDLERECQRDPAISRFADALTSWQARWGLLTHPQDPWVLEVALNTVSVWSSGNRPTARWSWPYRALPSRRPHRRLEEPLYRVSRARGKPYALQYRYLGWTTNYKPNRRRYFSVATKRKMRDAEWERPGAATTGDYLRLVNHLVLKQDDPNPDELTTLAKVVGLHLRL